MLSGGCRGHAVLTWWKLCQMIKKTFASLATWEKCSLRLVRKCSTEQNSTPRNRTASKCTGTNDYATIQQNVKTAKRRNNLHVAVPEDSNNECAVLTFLSNTNPFMNRLSLKSVWMWIFTNCTLIPGEHNPLVLYTRFFLGMSCDALGLCFLPKASTSNLVA